MENFTLKGLNFFKPFFLVALLLLLTSKGYSQYATKHYIAAAPWDYSSNANEFIVSCSAGTASVTVTKSDGTAITTLSVTSGTPVAYRPAGAPASKPANAINTIYNDRGLIFTSDLPISVSVRNVESDQVGGGNPDQIKGNSSLASYGNEAIGSSFRVGYYRSNFTGLYAYSPTGFPAAAAAPVYSVMAIDNNTVVSKNGTVLVTLNAGQSYLFQTTIGSLITSSKAVVMNSGQWRDVPTGCGDAVLNEIPPVRVLGTNYLVVRGNGTTRGASVNTNFPEQTLFIATEDNTTVTVNTVNTAGTITAINTYVLSTAGSYQNIFHGIDGVQYSASVISSDKKIVVYSGTAEGCEVDMACVAPVSACTGSFRVETKKFTKYDNNNLPYFGYVLVNDPTAVVNINGSNLETLAGARKQIGTSGFYIIGFTNANILNPTDLIFTSTVRMSVSMVQQGGGFSMASYLSSFNDQATQMFSPTINGAGCVTVLTAEPGLAPYQWYLNDVLIPGATSQTFVPTVTGSYSVAGTKSCGLSVASTPVNVGCIPIDAVDDGSLLTPFATVISGSTLATSVKANDLIDGTPVTTANTIVTAKAQLPLSIDPAGIITVKTGTTNGVYSIDYELCSTSLSPTICDKATAYVKVTVLPGSIATNQTICSGGDPAPFTSTSDGVGEGTISYRWESSVSPFSTWTTIPGATAATYDAPSGLTTTTNYRRIAISTLGESDPTSSVTVTLATPTLTGASQAASVCVGSRATINLTGLLANTTSTIAYTINGVSQPTRTTGVSNASGAASFTSALLTAANNGQILQITGITTTSTTPNCSQTFTQNVTLSVNPTSVGGTVSSPQTICSGTSPADLTLGGNTGSVVKWQKSSDAAFTAPTDIVGTSTTLTGAIIGNLSANTYFRAVVQSGVCAVANSASVLVSISPIPTITGASQASAVCAGLGATINLTGLLASSVSTIAYTINGVAQTAVTGVVANGSGVASFTSASLTAANNGQTLQITGITSTSATPNCSQTFSQNATLSVNPLPDASLVLAGTGSICSGTGTNITVANSVSGINYQLRNGATNVGVAVAGTGTATPINLPTGNLTSTMTFNVLATNTTTTCSQQLTETEIVTVNPTPAAPTVAVTAPTCASAATNILSTYDASLTYTSTPSGLTVGVAGVITGGTDGTSYTITAENASNCSATSASFTYNGGAILPTPAAPTVAVTAPTCASAATNILSTYDASLTYTSTPSGLTVGAAGVITGGTDGTSYTITAENASNCSATSASFTYNGGAILPTPAAPTVAVTAPTCASAATNILSTYDASLTYTSTPSGLTVGAAGVITGGTDGTSYTITAENASNCSATSASFTYNGGAILPTPAAPTVAVTAPTCASAATNILSTYDASLTYTSTPSGLTVGAAGVITGGTDGTSYTITAENASNCSATSASFTYNGGAILPTPAAPTVAVTAPTCASAATNILSTYDASLTYTSTPSGLTVGAAGVITGGTDGTSYTITAENASNCSATSASFTYNGGAILPTPAAPTVAVTAPTCASAATNILSTYDASLTYTSTPSGLTVGAAGVITGGTDGTSYTITAENASNCSATSASFTYNGGAILPTPAAPTVAVTAPTCASAATNILSTYDASLTYTSTPSGLTVGVAGVITGGTDGTSYTITAENASNCSATSASFTYNGGAILPTPAAPTVAVTAPTCASAATNILSTYDASLTYTSTPSGLTVGVAGVITGGTDGTSYTITAENASNCSATSASFTYNGGAILPTPAAPTVAVTAPTCASAATNILSTYDASLTYTSTPSGLTVGVAGVITGGTDGTSYTITAENASNCSATSASFTYNGGAILPTPAAPTVAVTAPTCASAATNILSTYDASLTYTSTPSGLTVGVAGVITGGTDGTSYTITAENASNCSATSASFTYNGGAILPTPAAPTVAVTAPTCASAATNILSTYDASLTYTSTPSGLTVGVAGVITGGTDGTSYTITAENASNCSATSASFTYNGGAILPTPAAPTVAVTAPTCASAATNILSTYDASLTYTSTPSGLTVGAAGVITGGTDGTSYTITAENASNCSATSASFTYNGGAILPTPAAPTVAVTAPTCASAATNILSTYDASLTYTSTPSGLTVGVAGVITGGTDGTSYTITAENASNCSATSASFTYNGGAILPTPAAPTVAVTAPTCASAATNILSTYDASLTYTSTPSGLTVGAAGVITGGTDGTSYTITAENASNCSATSASFTYNGGAILPTPAAPTVAVTAPTCASAATNILSTYDASLTYTSTPSGLTVGAAGVITGGTDGTSYTITAENASNCSATSASFTYNGGAILPTPAAPTVAVTAPTCASAATNILSTYDASLTYTSTPSGLTVGAAGVITGGTDGTSYTITAENASNCSATSASFTYNGGAILPTPAAPTVAVTAPTCASAATNILSTYDASLTYTSTPSGLTVGAAGVITGGTDGTSYTITAENASNCSATSASFTYNGGAILPTPAAPTVAVTAPTCASAATNILSTYDASLTYTSTPSGLTVGAAGVITGGTDGTSYTITAENASNCSATSASFTYNGGAILPTPAAPTVAVTAPTCASAATNILSTYDASLTYTSTPSGLTVGVAGVITGGTDGTSYTITAENASNCSATSASFTYNGGAILPTPAAPTVAVTAPTCASAATNILSTYDASLTYTSTPSGLTVGVAGVITGGTDGTSYTITAENASNCSATSASFTYNGGAILPTPAAPTVAVTAPTCASAATNILSTYDASLTYTSTPSGLTVGVAGVITGGTDGTSYTITAENASNCSATSASFTYNGGAILPTPAAPTVAVTAPTCASAATNILSTYDASLTYTSTPSGLTVGAAGVITGGTDGTSYTITAENASNCSATSASFTYNGGAILPTPAAPTVAVTAPTCASAATNILSTYDASLTYTSTPSGLTVGVAGVITGGTDGTSYTITAENASNCSATSASFTYNGGAILPTPAAPTVAVTAPTCASAATNILSTYDASLTYTSTPSGLTVGAAGVITGGTDGTSYTITAENASNCSATSASFTYNGGAILPTPAAPTVAVTAPTCASAATNILSTYDASLTYTSTPSGLTVGAAGVITGGTDGTSYTITAENASNCSATSASFTYNGGAILPTPAAPTVAVTAPTCASAATNILSTYDASLTYTSTPSGLTVGAAGVITGGTDGTSYTITAENASNCSATSASFTYNGGAILPTPAAPTVAVTAPTCASAATNILSTYDASLTYTSTPSGLTVGVAGVITGGTDGTSYTITAENASNCSATSASFTYNGGAILPTPAAPTVAVTAPTCASAATNILSTYDASLTYTSTPSGLTVGVAGVITGGTDGTSYTITAENASNCSATSASFTYNGGAILPTPAAPTVAVTAPTCASAATNILSTYDASLTYTSTPSGLTVGVAGVITGGTDGTSYTITAENASNCSATSASFTYNGGAILPTPAAPTVAVTAPTCASAATNILSTYDASLTYTSTPSGLTVGAAGVITGGTDGTSYTITAENASNCSATSASFTYNGGAILPTPAAPTVAVTAPTCASAATNILSTYDASLTYTSTPSGLTVGVAGVITGGTDGTSYTITAENASNCSATSASFTYNGGAILPTPAAPTVAVTAPTCASAATNILSTYDASLTYTSTPSGLTVGVAGVITGGTDGTSYTITAENASNCSATSASFTYNGGAILPTPAAPTVAVTAPTCASAATNILSTYDASLTYTSTPSGLTVGAAGVITGGTDGTSYTITAENASNCSATSASFTYNGGAILPTPAAPTVAVTAPTCASAATNILSTYDASLTYTSTPSGLTVGAAGVITGGTDGTSYTITAENASNCSATSASFTYNGGAILPTPAAPTVAVTAPTCASAATNILSTYDASLTYTSTPSGLTVGAAGVITGGTDGTSYTITAENASNCSATSASFTYNGGAILPTPAAPTVAVTAPTCASAATNILSTYDASLTYTSTPSGLTVGAAGVITGGTDGTSYTITAENASNCSATSASFTYNGGAILPTPAAPTVAVTAPTCASAATNILSTYDASLTYTSTPSGLTVGAAGVITGGTDGTSYTITAENASNCSATSASFTYNGGAILPTPAAPTVAVTAPTCASAATNILSTYDASLTYTSTPSGLTVGVAGVITGGTDGTSYTITAENASNCSATSASFTYNGGAILPTPAAPTVAVTAPTCASAATNILSTYDASLTYTSTPSGLTVGAAGVITGGTDGTSYTITAENASNCSATSASFTYNGGAILPTPAAPTVAVTAPTCASAATNILSTYDASLTYTSTPSGLTVGAAGVITGGTDGTSYTITAENASNCSATSASFTYNGGAILPTPAAPTVAVTAPTCASAATNILSTYDASLTYTSTPSGLTVGAAGVITGGTDGTSYTITAENASNCSATSASFTYNGGAILPTPAAPTVAVTAPTCASAATNILSTYDASLTYTSTPSGLTVGAAGVITGGTDGTSYTITAENASNCSATSASFTYNGGAILPTPAAPTVAVTAPTCASAATNILSTYDASLTYTSTPSGLTVGVAGVITGGTDGTSYTITAENASNCSATSASFTYNGGAILPTPAAPTVVVLTQATCAVPTGSVELSELPSGKWIINPGAMSGNRATTSITGLSTGTYNYTITNSIGCTSLPTADIIISKVICAVDDTISGGNGTTATANAGNVLIGNPTNPDTLNGIAVAIGLVNLTVTTPATPATVGSPIPSIDVTTGQISVPANTPAGVYTILYSICEKLNPANCDTAISTVVVSTSVIDAVTETTPSINGLPGGTTATLVANDTLNGSPVVIGTNPGQVTLTGVTVPTGLTLNADGTVTIAPNTAAGNYSIEYKICEVTNPANCDTVISTVVVSTSVIDTVTETTPSINGLPGGTTATLVANDTLNGSPVVIGTNPGQVTLTGVTVPTGLTLNADGTVTIAPNTAAGNYSIEYKICEVTNPANCDTVISTVVVSTSVIDAVTETTPSINGLPGGTTATLVANDTLNGSPVVIGTNPGQVTLTGVTVPTGLTLNADGTVTIAPNTAAGNYSIEYKICEVTNPANCDTVISTVVVSTSVIDAVTETTPSINGLPGGTTATLVANDTLNGSPVVIGTNPGQVTLTGVTVPTGLTLNADGTVTVAPNTAAGNYSVEYKICEVTNPANCDTVISTVVVNTIDAQDDVLLPIIGTYGGLTDNILLNDSVNGILLSAATFNSVTVTPIGVYPNGLTLNSDGAITVAVGATIGNYTLQYQICSTATPTVCDVANISIEIKDIPTPAPPVIFADDDLGGPITGINNVQNILNVLDNDFVDLNKATLSNVVLATVTADSTGYMSLKADGTIELAANTPAGTYVLTYSICDITHANNCDTASVTVTVVCNTSTVISGIVYNAATNAPLANVPVTLKPINTTTGPVLLRLTKADGSYAFSGMIPGDYVLQVQDANLNAAQELFNTTSSFLILKVENCNYQKIDFGYDKTDLLVLGDFVWYDLNDNGIQDEWYDANNDGLVTQNVPDSNGVIDYSKWEWIDFNGDGSYKGKENAGELNAAGFGNGTTNVPNIFVTGPNGFSRSVTMGVEGYWRTRAPKDAYGEYKIEFIKEANFELASEAMSASGLVKVLPSVTTKQVSTNKSKSYVDCGLTTNNILFAQFSATEKVHLELDFGISCKLYADIVANTDDAGTVEGTQAQNGVFDVLANDTLNGSPVKLSDVTISLTPTPYFTLGTDGLLNTLANIPGGTYTLTYSICEKANPSNCSTTTVTVFVARPSIALVKTAHFNDENGDGYAQAGETITYSFEITNTGNTPLTNVTINDPLPGVVMSGTPLVLAIGESNANNFKGQFVIKQTDINIGFVSNQATVYGTSPQGTIVEDKSDEMNLVDDNPTVLAVSGCAIKVFNAVSPDGDGENDKFYIRGLECYPDNTVEIYNRWGVLVFERGHYNNEDKAFRGTSEGRVTFEKSAELPVGTYFYILKYKDSNSNAFEKSGYLYLNRK
ncbi:gliding motility-associated C-terminal domain-containing protein [Flavobacterium sp. N3904]|uniref:gliding motility-associated C-terminal domain-containing protein n=1 Tax=Flavobacterium sp. N3904 TaxID=2986835 RepID=UPI002223F7B1|nr:gliding motility-associated C-terminal domain-containing protein [Flavobacterium sp. N3904]